jgi:hypothetical protein
MNDRPLYQSAEADKWFDRYLQAIHQKNLAIAELTASRAREAKLREALEWYANPAWESYGQRARAALAGEENTP